MILPFTYSSDFRFDCLEQYTDSSALQHTKSERQGQNQEMRKTPTTELNIFLSKKIKWPNVRTVY